MIVDVTNKLIIDPRAHSRVNGEPAWCELPYPGHKKGCPNYGKGCPLPKVDVYFDLTMPHWFAIHRFDLKAHVERMRDKHPEWSDRQCRCVLYWQNGVRKSLNIECSDFILQHRGLVYHKIPEAMGVNVILTMKIIDQQIIIKPIDEVCKVALIGSPAME